MNPSFDLPEGQARAYRAVGGVCVQVVGSPPYLIGDCYLESGYAGIVYTFKFRMMATNRVWHVSLNRERCKLFAAWLSDAGVTFTTGLPHDPADCQPKFDNAGLDRAYDSYRRTTEERAVCPDCYGTGFRRGFGAPCARGCKP